MIRTVTIVPGFDCIRGPCPSRGCPGRRGLDDGGSHGIHGDEWVYAVAFEDRKAALVLTVYTDLYPATVPRRFDIRPLAERRRGADVTLHVRSEHGPPCEFLDGAPCRGIATSGILADKVFKAHGDPSIPEPQPEALWRALEAQCDAWYTQHLAEAAEDERTRCPACKGTGRRPDEALRLRSDSARLPLELRLPHHRSPGSQGRARDRR